MKYYIISVLSILLLFQTSCGSDVLTKNKVKSIIQNCSNENPYNVTTNILLGEHRLEKQHFLGTNIKNKIKEYQPLIDAGLIEIKYFEAMRQDISLSRKRTKSGKSEIMTKLVDIQPTAKGKKYLITPEPKTSGEFILYEYQISEVTEIHERPAFNVAEVFTILKPANQSPFAEILNKKNDVPKERKFVFKKTDNGWTFCEGKEKWYNLF